MYYLIDSSVADDRVFGRVISVHRREGPALAAETTRLRRIKRAQTAVVVSSKVWTPGESLPRSEGEIVSQSPGDR